jgi:hypothetical protein
MDKWRWMSERKVDFLAALFHEEAVFVHMGATMSKKQELDVIRGGGFSTRTWRFRRCRFGSSARPPSF